jgi:hypothetical protein
MRTAALVTMLLMGCTGQLPTPGPLPADKTFVGVWDSNWGQMKLRPGRGSIVNGSFRGFREGSVSGTVEGNLYRFTWRQVNSTAWGRGYLQMSPDGEHLEGQWGYEKSYNGGGRWWASRSSASLAGE